MLDLYIMETCPYCRKVMNFMDENHIKYNKLDISDNKNLQDLISMGGKEQIPFLYDEENSVKMYESDDIIDYLKR